MVGVKIFMIVIVKDGVAVGFPSVYDTLPTRELLPRALYEMVTSVSASGDSGWRGAACTLTEVMSNTGSS